MQNPFKKKPPGNSTTQFNRSSLQFALNNQQQEPSKEDTARFNQSNRKQPIIENIFHRQPQKQCKNPVMPQKFDGLKQKQQKSNQLQQIIIKVNGKPSIIKLEREFNLNIPIKIISINIDQKAKRQIKENRKETDFLNYKVSQYLHISNTQILHCVTNKPHLPLQRQLVDRLTLGLKFYDHDQDRQNIFYPLIQNHNWKNSIASVSKHFKTDLMISYYLIAHTMIVCGILQHFPKDLSNQIQIRLNQQQLFNQVLKFTIQDKISMISIYLRLLIDRRPSAHKIIPQKTQKDIVQVLIDKIPTNDNEKELSDKIIELLEEYWKKTTNQQKIGIWYPQYAKLIKKLKLNQRKKINELLIQYYLDNQTYELSNIEQFQPLIDYLLKNKEINYHEGFRSFDIIENISSKWNKHILKKFSSLLERDITKETKKQLSYQLAFAMVIFKKMQQQQNQIQKIFKKLLIKLFNSVYQSVLLNFLISTIQVRQFHCLSFTILKKSILINQSTTENQQIQNMFLKDINREKLITAYKQYRQLLVMLFEQIVKHYLKTEDLEQLQRNLFYGSFGFSQQSKTINFFLLFSKKYRQYQELIFDLAQSYIYKITQPTQINQSLHKLVQFYKQNSQRSQILFKIIFQVLNISFKISLDIMPFLKQFRSILTNSNENSGMVNIEILTKMFQKLQSYKQSKNNTMIKQFEKQIVKWIQLFQIRFDINQENEPCSYKEFQNVELLQYFCELSKISESCVSQQLKQVICKQLQMFKKHSEILLKIALQSNKTNPICKAKILMIINSQLQLNIKNYKGIYNYLISRHNNEQKLYEKLLQRLMQENHPDLTKFLNFSLKNDKFTTQYLISKNIFKLIEQTILKKDINSNLHSCQDITQLVYYSLKFLVNANLQQSVKSCLKNIHKINMSQLILVLKEIISQSCFQQFDVIIDNSTILKLISNCCQLFSQNTDGEHNFFFENYLAQNISKKFWKQLSSVTDHELRKNFTIYMSLLYFKQHNNCLINKILLEKWLYISERLIKAYWIDDWTYQKEINLILRLVRQVHEQPENRSYYLDAVKKIQKQLSVKAKDIKTVSQKHIFVLKLCQQIIQKPSTKQTNRKFSSTNIFLVDNLVARDQRQFQNIRDKFLKAFENNLEKSEQQVNVGQISVKFMEFITINNYKLRIQRINWKLQLFKPKELIWILQIQRILIPFQQSISNKRELYPKLTSIDTYFAISKIIQQQQTTIQSFLVFISWLKFLNQILERKELSLLLKDNYAYTRQLITSSASTFEQLFNKTLRPLSRQDYYFENQSIKFDEKTSFEMLKPFSMNELSLIEIQIKLSLISQYLQLCCNANYFQKTNLVQMILTYLQDLWLLFTDQLSIKFVQVVSFYRSSQKNTKDLDYLNRLLLPANDKTLRHEIFHIVNLIIRMDLAFQEHIFHKLQRISRKILLEKENK